MRLNHVLRTTQYILIVGITASLLGCATTKPRHEWTDQALAAENAQYDGRLDDAEAAYRELLAAPPSDDRRRWLQFNLGMIALLREEPEVAKQRFATVYAEEIRDLHGANALYEVAKLAHDDQPAATELRLDVVRRYPDEVAADFALQDIVRIQIATENFRELEALLLNLVEETAGTAVGDNVWFELAQLRDEKLHDPNGALDAYRQLFARFEKGPLADDALWEMAQIYSRHQMWEPALALLQKLAEEVEASWFVGSYESDWVDDAIYEAGWINLVFRADYSTAAKWFKRYIDKFPEGLLADDAAWNLVESARLTGDEDQYRDALRSFVENYPESRYVRRARARLEGDS